jgi:PAS domain S-box-containing protein
MTPIRQELAEDMTQQLSAAMEQTADTVIITSRDGTIEYVNPAFEELTGYGRQEILGIPAGILKSGKHDQRFYERLWHTISSGTPFRGEIIIRKKNGEEVVDEQIITPLRDSSGIITHFISTGKNITDRKRAEESLSLVRALLDNANDMIYVLDPVSFVVLDANNAALHQLGYTREELSHLTTEDVDPQTADPATFQRVRERLKMTGHTTFETAFRRKDGSRLDVETTLSLAQLERVYVLGVARDITERKQADTAVRSSEAKLSNAVQLAHLGPWEFDVATALFTFTDEFYAMMHTTVEQVGSYAMSPAEYAERFVHPDDRHLVHLEGRRVSETRDPHFNHQLEHRIMYPDGGVGYITVRIFVVMDEHGHVIKTYGVNQDITERKHAEEALRDREERLRLVVEASNNGIWEWNILTSDVWLSDRAFEMLRLPAGTSPIHIDTIKQLIHPEDRSCFVETLGKHLVTLLPYDIELRFQGGDGSIRHFSCRGKSLRDETGRGFKMFGSIEDITERKQAMITLQENEVRLRLMLNEKEVLLKEIHHRVKNNLQVVSSLLDLQAVHAQGKELTELFNETQNRVRAMASIHEHLYGGDDLGRVDFQKQTCDMVQHLIRVYGPPDVRPQVDVEQLFLGVDTAIPCSLIINELVSNSLKHAFPDGRSGCLYVGMHNAGGNTFRLQVKDDGVGFPKHSSWVSSKSLGLELVKILTEQLGGSIEFANGTGSSFTIVFDLTR